MPDEIFANSRLAEIYDAVDSDRSDLAPYLAIVDEFEAKEVLDLGCGTGTFACLLVERGVDVVGVDPAEASLEIASAKPGADEVRWIHGDATSLPGIAVDLATMTGNVAQVFLDDSDWLATLSRIAGVVRPSGRLVFETRRPGRRAWEEWTRGNSWRRIKISGIGVVETWVELTDVSLPLVSFKHTYRFETDGAVLTSDSTLRFRELDELETSLTATGWNLVEIRDAPDRPGREYVCVAARSETYSCPHGSH